MPANLFRPVLSFPLSATPNLNSCAISIKPRAPAFFFLLHAFFDTFGNHHITTDTVDCHRVASRQNRIVMTEKLRIGSRPAIETANHTVGNIQYHLITQRRKGTSRSAGVVPHWAVKPRRIGNRTESQVLHTGSNRRSRILSAPDVDDFSSPSPYISL